MNPYRLSHLADHALLHALASLVQQDRQTTARLLAHLAEVDERRLYLPKAFPSMYAYCVQELGMSEDTACRRINIARAARIHPILLPALADGRLNLTTALLLVPHLRSDNASELVAAAAGRSKEQVLLALAQRFPRPDVPERITPVMPVQSGTVPTPATDGLSALARVVPSGGAGSAQLMGPLPVSSSDRPAASAPGVMPVAIVPPPPPRPRLTPLAPERYALQVTLDQETHDLLREARELLGHTAAGGDVADVLKRGLRELVHKLRARKCAETSRPRRARHSGGDDPRRVPASTRREVWRRDGGRCTFVSDAGRRCESRSHLELDHVQPVARGGRATVANLRLRCRAHNQHAADVAFGAGFMREKRGGRESAGMPSG